MRKTENNIQSTENVGTKAERQVLEVATFALSTERVRNCREQKKFAIHFKFKAKVNRRS